MAGQKMELGPTASTVAENIKRFRVGAALNYADLSRKVAEHGRPISALAIRRIEELGRRVDVDELTTLAVALNVNPNALLLPNYSGDAQRGDGITGMPEDVTGADLWSWGDGWQALPHERSDAPEIDVDATGMERGRQGYRKHAVEAGRGFLGRIRPEDEGYEAREFLASVSNTMSKLGPGHWISLWGHTGKALGSYRLRAYPESGWSDVSKYFERISSEMVGIITSEIAAPFIDDVIAERARDGNG